jgi:glycosyltransferase involved in cell wall biosynthesis
MQQAMFKNNAASDAEQINLRQAAVDLSVVIPAFNEEKAIGYTVAEISNTLSPLPISFEIIVVDDGSADGTRNAAQQSGARVIANPRNLGYGASLKRGIAAGNSTYVAIIDADGTYPASNLPKMLELAQSADMVVGARNAKMTNVPLIRRVPKFILGKIANFLARQTIPDLNSGMRVFRRKSLLAFVPLLPTGFSFTTTITLCMISSDLTVQYIPIEYRRRIGRSTIRWTDFFRFVLLIVRSIVLFSPLRVFIPLGTFVFLPGICKLAYDALVVGRISESAVLGVLAAIMIWTFGLMADMIARLHLRP